MTTVTNRDRPITTGSPTTRAMAGIRDTSSEEEAEEEDEDEGKLSYENQ